MQIAKWGNSLAIRLPKKLVAELQLKAGENVKYHKKDLHYGEMRVFCLLLKKCASFPQLSLDRDGNKIIDLDITPSIIPSRDFRSCLPRTLPVETPYEIPISLNNYDAAYDMFKINFVM